MFNFEKLEVWHKAVEFADQVYTVTRSFPEDERFGLTNQMRRAAVSTSSNIAEGSSRSSKSDFARFVQMAAGSVFEVVSQAFVRLYAAAEEQSKMLSGLKRSLNQPLSTID
jgi:hypothetical protein